MRKFLKRFLIYSVVFFILVFILLNIVAYKNVHAFTHYDTTIQIKPTIPNSFTEKLTLLWNGAHIPKAQNTNRPPFVDTTIILKSNSIISCWYSKQKNKKSKGTVILFHGWMGCKSFTNAKASYFYNSGYNTLQVDFMGSGDSPGNECSFGYFESEQVKTCIEYVLKTGEENIILFGQSLGAAAILKCLSDHAISINKCILECPFGTMYETIEGRCKRVGMPIWPTVSLLLFWGEKQMNFSCYNHNPIDYAKNISAPVLLMIGEKDSSVKLSEVQQIYANLKGNKKLFIVPNSGHNIAYFLHKTIWTKEVESFLNN